MGGLELHRKLAREGLSDGMWGSMRVRRHAVLWKSVHRRVPHIMVFDVLSIYMLERV